MSRAALGPGEGAVIQLAAEQAIQIVCLDVTEVAVPRSLALTNQERILKFRFPVPVPYSSECARSLRE